MLLPGIGTRKSWAHPIPSLIDADSIPKYVNPLPNPLDPSFIFNPTTLGGTHYEIAIAQTQQNILGPGFPDTTVWGYGNALQSTTYPGRSFVVRRDQQINIVANNTKNAHASRIQLLIRNENSRDRNDSNSIRVDSLLPR